MNYKEAPILCELTRKEEPMTAYIEIDKNIAEIKKYFDYDFDGSNAVYPFELPELPEFKTLVITGSSGSGKSTLLKEFNNYKNGQFNFDNRAIISQMDDFDKITRRFNCIGLCSVPTWCKPYNVLSVGESFRANVALSLDNYTLYDEFTSTIDRNVAKSTAKGLSKLIERENLHHIVLCSCHNDYIPFLDPDIVIDTDEEKIYDCREVCLRSEIRIEVYESSDKSDWHKFCKHHYLNRKHNNSAKLYKAYWNNNLIGWYSVLAMPTCALKNAFIAHRIVVLPDFQGLGIGNEFMKTVQQYYVDNGDKIFIRTTHIKIVQYMKKHAEIYEEKSSSGKRSSDGGNSHKIESIKYDTDRVAYSFEYRGEKYGRLPHKTIIIPDGQSYPEAKLLIESRKYYLTVVTGIQKETNDIERICKKHGIRTETLYERKNGEKQIKKKWRQ